MAQRRSRRKNDGVNKTICVGDDSNVTSGITSNIHIILYFYAIFLLNDL